MIGYTTNKTNGLTGKTKFTGRKEKFMFLNIVNSKNYKKNISDQKQLQFYKYPDGSFISSISNVYLISKKEPNHNLINSDYNNLWRKQRFEQRKKNLKFNEDQYNQKYVYKRYLREENQIFPNDFIRKKNKMYLSRESFQLFFQPKNVIKKNNEIPKRI